MNKLCCLLDSIVYAALVILYFATLPFAAVGWILSTIHGDIATRLLYRHGYTDDDIKDKVDRTME